MRRPTDEPSAAFTRAARSEPMPSEPMPSRPAPYELTPYWLTLPELAPSGRRRFGPAQAQAAQLWGNQPRDAEAEPVTTDLRLSDLGGARRSRRGGPGRAGRLRGAGSGRAARPELPPELNPRYPRRRRSPLRRLSVTLVAIISVTVLGLSSVGWAAYRHFDNAIDRNNWEPAAGDRPEAVPGDLNILLLGNDSREGTHGEFGDPGGTRADTTIIAHFDSDGTATLLSFPRDTLVPVVPEEAATANDGQSKLADVIPLAGVPGLISTLESFTGLKINHTVSINLAGFRAMTDAVGGVTVCVRPLPDGSTRNLHDQESGWRGQLGENRLDGDQALAFVRTRKALGEERLRILRQQQFLSRLLDAATSAGVLTNPAKITSLLGAVGGALEVSESLGQTEMFRLAKRVSELGPGGLRFVTIPTYIPLAADGATDPMGTIPPHGMVLLHDPVGLEALLRPMRAESENQEFSGAALARQEVTVAEVVNAAGREGLATSTITDLQALGFGGPMSPETGTRRQVATEIRHAAGQEAAARTLAAVLPGARLVTSTEADGLVLVLGSSFAGVTDLATPGGTASATSTGTAPTDTTTAGAASTGTASTGTDAATGAVPSTPGAAAGDGVTTAAVPPPADTSCTP